MPTKAPIELQAHLLLIQVHSRHPQWGVEELIQNCKLHMSGHPGVDAPLELIISMLEKGVYTLTPIPPKKVPWSLCEN